MSQPSVRFAFLFGALITLAGCGGGAEPTPPGDNNPPPPPPTGQLIVDFPPAHVFVEAVSAPDITVRGRASAETSIAGVSVNGISASSEDGFANWQVTIPLENPDGDNVLELALEIPDGTPPPATEVIVTTVPPLPVNLTSMAIDPATDTGYLGDPTRDAVYAWNPGDRGRFVQVAGENLPDGEPPMDVWALYPAWDAPGNRLLFGDDRKLFGMDPATGELAVLADNDGKGQGPELPSVQPLLATDPANDSVYAVYSGPGLETAIFQIDLASGDRSLLPIDSADGPVPGAISATAIDVDSGHLYLADFVAGGVIDINLNDGSRSVIDIVLVNVIQGMVFDTANRDLIFTVNPGNNRAVYRVDVGTGELKVISDNSTGQGIPFARLGGIALSDDGRLFVVDTDRNTVFEVDSQTGDRQVAALQLGAGASWAAPGDLVLAEDRSALRVVDVKGDGITTLPLTGGERTAFVASDAMARPPRRLVQALDSPTLYVLGDTGGLHAVDAVTGIVTSLPVNAEEIFDVPYIRDYIVEHGLQQAWFLVPGDAEGVIGRINLATGESEIISGAGKGTGEPMTVVTAITRDTESGQIVAWQSGVTIFIDPDTGDRDFRALPENFQAASLQRDENSFILANHSSIRRYSPDTETFEVLISSDNGKGMSGANYGGRFAYDSERRVIYQSSNDLRAVIAIDIVTGEEVILAR